MNSYSLNSYKDNKLPKSVIVLGSIDISIGIMLLGKFGKFLIEIT